jgi:predicted transcriptional regulator
MSWSANIGTGKTVVRRIRKMSEGTKKDMRLHEGELNVMELLWSNKVLAAKDISKIIKEYIGWEKNTTYTVIKRLIDKGAISREDPGFLCRAEVTKRQVQEIETRALFSKMFNGSLTSFIMEYLGNRKLTTEEVIELQRVLNKQI